MTPISGAYKYIYSLWDILRLCQATQETLLYFVVKLVISVSLQVRKQRWLLSEPGSKY